MSQDMQKSLNEHHRVVTTCIALSSKECCLKDQLCCAESLGKKYLFGKTSNLSPKIPIQGTRRDKRKNEKEIYEKG